MDASVGLLIGYLASLAKIQAEKLAAERIQLFRLNSMTVPVEPNAGHCPSCAALRARLAILEQVHAFLLRILKRSEVAYIDLDKAWVCAFVEQYAIPKREIKTLFGVSIASYYRWRKRSLGFGVAAFRHLAKMLPDTITFWVYAVKAANPSWGKIRISQAMARIGLPISPSSVWRYPAQGSAIAEEAFPQASRSRRHWHPGDQPQPLLGGGHDNDLLFWLLPCPNTGRHRSLLPQSSCTSCVLARLPCRCPHGDGQSLHPLRQAQTFHHRSWQRVPESCAWH